MHMYEYVPAKEPEHDVEEPVDVHDVDVAEELSVGGLQHRGQLLHALEERLVPVRARHPAPVVEHAEAAGPAAARAAAARSQRLALPHQSRQQTQVGPSRAGTAAQSKHNFRFSVLDPDHVRHFADKVWLPVLRMMIAQDHDQARLFLRILSVEKRLSPGKLGLHFWIFKGEPLFKPELEPEIHPFFPGSPSLCDVELMRPQKPKQLPIIALAVSRSPSFLQVCSLEFLLLLALLKLNAIRWNVCPPERVLVYERFEPTQSRERWW